MFASFRLKPGRDDDLIAWLINLQPGDRSYHIRETIRKGLTASPRRPETPQVTISPKQKRSEQQIVNSADLETALDSW